MCLLPCPSLPFSDISLLLSRKCWGTCSSHEASKIHPPGARTLCKGNLMSIHFTVTAFCKLAACVSLAPQLQDVTTFNTPRSCPPMFYLFSVTQGQLRPPQNTPNMCKREPKIGQANYSVACLQPTEVLPDITNLQREAPSFAALKCKITTPLFLGMVTEMVAFSVPGSRPVAHTKLPSELPCLGLD